MNEYRFAGVPQKIVFKAKSTVVEFVPDAECVVRYYKDKDTELKFFVLTSESAECIGDQFKDFVEIEVCKGKEHLFAVGNRIVMELAAEKRHKKAEVTFANKMLSQKDFRVASLAK